MKTGAPASGIEAVVDRYAGGVDRTLLRRNLQLSPQERLDQLQELARFADELRHAGRTARRRTAK